MYFVANLPIEQNYTRVLIIVNNFLKICMFIPLSSTASEHVAQAFFQYMVADHGLPHHIISERDPKFTGELWQALMKEIKTELHFSTAFHPQSDKLAEVGN